MIYVTTFFEVLGRWWWVILLATLLPYIFYYIKRFIHGTRKKNFERERRKKYLKVETVEGKNLDFSFAKINFEEYKERIENLILNLDQNDTVTVNAIEAMVMVEYFSTEINIGENGELVITKDVAHKFSKKIYHNPRKFMTYIIAVEKRIDINNPENKIPLGDVLYMMKNARKFGLKLEGEGDELLFEIKKAVYESNYKDVIIKIVDDKEEIERREKEAALEKEIVLKNIAEQTSTDDNIRDVEVLEDGKLKITSKEGIVTIKDDFVIYSVTEPEENGNNQKGTIHNREEETRKLFEKNKTEKTQYISKFGELQGGEHFDMPKPKLLDRSVRFLHEAIDSVSSFTGSDLKTKNYFESDKLYYFFMEQLFNQRFAFYQAKPHVFIGKLGGNRQTDFISIDVHYFLNYVYYTTKREDRENLYHFFYNRNKNLNFENVEKFIKNINEERNIFYGMSDKFISDAIYTFNSTTIKTKVFLIKMESFNLLLNEKEEILSMFTELKEMIDENIKPHSFGVRAQKNKADFEYTHDTFFRPLIDEIQNVSSKTKKETEVEVDSETEKIIEEDNKPF